MGLPRFRLTIRQLMAAIVGFAVGMGIVVGFDRMPWPIRESCYQIADNLSLLAGFVILASTLSPHRPEPPRPQ